MSKLIELEQIGGGEVDGIRSPISYRRLNVRSI